MERLLGDIKKLKSRLENDFRTKEKKIGVIQDDKKETQKYHAKKDKKYQ